MVILDFCFAGIAIALLRENDEEELPKEKVMTRRTKKKNKKMRNEQGHEKERDGKR